MSSQTSVAIIVLIVFLAVSYMTTEKNKTDIVISATENNCNIAIIDSETIIKCYHEKKNEKR